MPATLVFWGNIAIFIVAIVGAIWSFLIFHHEARAKRNAAPPEQIRAEAARSLVADGVSPIELLKALSTFTDALVKAGPGLAALAASIFFLSIAASIVSPKPLPASAGSGAPGQKADGNAGVPGGSGGTGSGGQAARGG